MVSIFENIEKGDTVLVYKKSHYGFMSYKEFLVPIKVVKTSKTLITIENGQRFKKKDGFYYGQKTDFKRIYLPGQNLKIPFGGVDTAKDQSIERDQFEKKLRLEREITNIFDDLNLEGDSSLTVKELENILSVLQDIQRRIDEKPK